MVDILLHHCMTIVETFVFKEYNPFESFSEPLFKYDFRGGVCFLMYFYTGFVSVDLFVCFVCAM